MGDFTIIFTDDDDNGCTTSLDIEAPMTCSDQCEISADLSNIVCDDNGTPSDPADDTFTFDVIISGSNTATSWTDNLGNSGAYDQTITLGPFDISNGDFTIIFTDDDDNGCTTSLDIVAPMTCSDHQ